VAEATLVHRSSDTSGTKGSRKCSPRLSLHSPCGFVLAGTSMVLTHGISPRWKKDFLYQGQPTPKWRSGNFGSGPWGSYIMVSQPRLLTIRTQKRVPSRSPFKGFEPCYAKCLCLPFQLATYLHMELLLRDIIWCLDLEALSVACSCLNFAPGDVRAILVPRPHYIPKIPFIAVKPVILQPFFPKPHDTQEQEILHLLYPVHGPKDLCTPLWPVA